MKKVVIVFAVVLISMINAVETKAQVAASVNIGMQPAWGPVGYDYVEYYYLPAYELYYYVPARQYVYWDGVQWVIVTKLPNRFRTVNFYTTYKVVINEPKPYLHHEQLKARYMKYKDETGKQEVIRDSKDPKYTEVKGKDSQPGKKQNDLSDPKPVQEKGDAQKGNVKEKEGKKEHRSNQHPKENHPK
jgi:hypothetical protein